MRPGLLIASLAVLVSCGGGSSGSSPASPSATTTSTPTYDISARGVPQFVSQRHVGLGGIARVSRYRSSAGHSYTDGSESCRSMKHYFTPKAGVDASTLVIFSPVTGVVLSTTPESSGCGTQVAIQPSVQPAFHVILFHVTLASPLATGVAVSAGQSLGAHCGTQTDSDIAVGVDTPQGYRLVSWFEVMTDALFQEFAAGGVGSRGDMIIARAARDADPLACSGDTFTTFGSLASWISLR